MIFIGDLPSAGLHLGTLLDLVGVPRCPLPIQLELLVKHELIHCDRCSCLLRCLPTAPPRARRGAATIAATTMERPSWVLGTFALSALSALGGGSFAFSMAMRTACGMLVGALSLPSWSLERRRWLLPLSRALSSRSVAWSFLSWSSSLLSTRVLLVCRQGGCDGEVQWRRNCPLLVRLVVRNKIWTSSHGILHEVPHEPANLPHIQVQAAPQRSVPILVEDAREQGAGQVRAGGNAGLFSLTACDVPRPLPGSH